MSESRDAAGMPVGEAVAAVQRLLSETESPPRWEVWRCAGGICRRADRWHILEYQRDALKRPPDEGVGRVVIHAPT